MTKIDISLLLSDFWKTQFLPNKNTAELQTNSQVNPLFFYYTAIFFSALFFLVIKTLRNKHFFTNKTLSSFFRVQITIFLIILIFSQTISHINYCKTELMQFYNKDIQQKISNNFEKSYAFAQHCKSHLQGKHICQPITGANLNPQKNLLTYLAVQYYLYPINIVTYRVNTNFDCMIIFLNNNPESHIPPSFTERHLFDSRSLIAIKEKTAL